MPVLDPSVWALIALAAVLAGFIDSAVGGGGMVLVPTLFTALPNTIPATLLGTNKMSGIGGTGMAALQFARKIPIQWRVVLPSMAAAFIAAGCGAYLVSFVPVAAFKKILPPLLVFLLIYTITNKQLGQASIDNKPATQKTAAVAIVFGATCGFYDGVFGPGTGSFLVLLWARLYTMDFMSASAHAKLVNVACNAGSLLWFSLNVPIFLGLGLMMLACNVAGAYIGAKTTLRYGNGFVRTLLIIVVLMLVLRTSYDAYFR